MRKQLIVTRWTFSREALLATLRSCRGLPFDLAHWMIGAPEGDRSDAWSGPLEQACAITCVVAFLAAAVGVCLHFGGYA